MAIAGMITTTSRVHARGDIHTREAILRLPVRHLIRSSALLLACLTAQRSVAQSTTSLLPDADRAARADPAVSRCSSAWTRYDELLGNGRRVPRNIGVDARHRFARLGAGAVVRADRERRFARRRRCPISADRRQRRRAGEFAHRHGAADHRVRTDEPADDRRRGSARRDADDARTRSSIRKVGDARTSGRIRRCCRQARRASQNATLVAVVPQRVGRRCRRGSRTARRRRATRRARRFSRSSRRFRR